MSNDLSHGMHPQGKSKLQHPTANPNKKRAKYLAHRLASHLAQAEKCTRDCAKANMRAYVPGSMQKGKCI